MDRHSLPAFNGTFVVSSEYELSKELGQGAHGCVIAAKHRGSGESCAVKKITNINTKLILAKRCLRELKLMRHFRKHQNITCLYDADIVFAPDGSFDSVYLYLELMDADLHRIIKSGQPLTDQHFQSFIYQTLCGLKYIHSAGVLHRDLKPANLLINQDCELKICDFGLARGYNTTAMENIKQSNGRGPGGYMSDYVAMRWYRAPELMLSFENYGPATDMWALGCILAELIGGKPMFQGRDYVHQLNMIIDKLGSPSEESLERIGSPYAQDYIRSLPNRARVPFLTLFPGANPLALDLLDGLLQFDPRNRITCSDALDHPYLADFNDPEDYPICDSPFGFEFENVDTREELLHLVAMEVASFRQESSRQNLERRQSVGARDAGNDALSVLQHGKILDMADDTDDKLQDVPRCVDDDFESFLAQLKACHEKLKQVERRCVLFGQSFSQIVKLSDAYVGAQTGEVSSIDNDWIIDMGHILDWYEQLVHWTESVKSFDTVSALVASSKLKKRIEEFYVRRPEAMRQVEKTLLQSSPDVFVSSYSEIIDGLRDAMAVPIIVQELADMNGLDAEAIVELLDNVLDIVEPSDLLHRKCLDIQRTLCGKNYVVPRSFTLPRGAVTRISSHPETSGGFADIWRGQYDDRDVALKVFRIYRTDTSQMGMEDLKSLYKEAIVWKRLRHPNITPFYGIDETTFPTQLALVSDWMPNGTIAHYLTKNPTVERISLCCDIAEGLRYLHAMDILHGDLKSANILVNHMQKACLSDFGLAAMHYSSKIATVSLSAGSMRWMAPELIDPERFGLDKAELTLQSDIYALSMVFWEIFTGLFPFHDCKRDAQVMSRILNGVRPPKPAQSTTLGLSNDVWSLMETCWEPGWQKRPSIAEVLERLSGRLMQSWR